MLYAYLILVSQPGSSALVQLDILHMDKKMMATCFYSYKNARQILSNKHKQDSWFKH